MGPSEVLSCDLPREGNVVNIHRCSLIPGGPPAPSSLSPASCSWVSSGGLTDQDTGPLAPTLSRLCIPHTVSEDHIPTLCLQPLQLHGDLKAAGHPSSTSLTCASFVRGTQTRSTIPITMGVIWHTLQVVSLKIPSVGLRGGYRCLLTFSPKGVDGTSNIKQQLSPPNTSSCPANPLYMLIPLYPGSDKGGEKDEEQVCRICLCLLFLATWPWKFLSVLSWCLSCSFNFHVQLHRPY